MTDFTNLDPQVVTLAKAIRQVESNTNYNATGDNGHSFGAYQWYDPNGDGKAHFQSDANTFGLDPNDFSPINQDKVAYSKIKAWKDSGFHAGEIAAMWNGSHLENGKPIANHPEYITKIQAALGDEQTPENSYNPHPYTSGEIQLPTPSIDPSKVVANDNAGKPGITLPFRATNDASDMPQFSGLPGDKAIQQTKYQIGQGLVGQGKGILNTLVGVGNLGSSVLHGALSPIVKKISGKNARDTQVSNNTAVTQPTNQAQSAGFIGNKIGQVLVPAYESGLLGSALGAAGKLGKIAKGVETAGIIGAALKYLLSKAENKSNP